MAALEIPQNILDKPLPEIPTFLGPLSPTWNQIAAMKPLQKSSFAEIFGELLFKEQHQHQHQPQPQSFSSSSVFSLYSDSSSSSSSTSSSFSSAASSSADATDTENDIEMFNIETSEEIIINKSPGSESSDVVDPDDEELMINDLGIEERPPVLCRRHLYAENRCSEWKRSKMIRAAFPPPISCIGRSGKPWVLFKSYRGDGRFVLKEIRIPTQEFMHACRKDGRLKLHIIQSDDEIPDDEDEYDEDEEEIDDNNDTTTEDDEEVGGKDDDDNNNYAESKGILGII